MEKCGVQSMLQIRTGQQEVWEFSCNLFNAILNNVSFRISPCSYGYLHKCHFAFQLRSVFIFTVIDSSIVTSWQQRSNRCEVMHTTTFGHLHTHARNLMVKKKNQIEDCVTFEGCRDREMSGYQGEKKGVILAGRKQNRIFRSAFRG